MHSNPFVNTVLMNIKAVLENISNGNGNFVKYIF